MSERIPGYMGKILRVDLSTGLLAYEKPEQDVLRKYIGGTGLGIYYLYNEVPPEVEWSDPENRFILMSGPLGGTVGPTGTYSIVTRGPMTNGAAATQANGMLGAFLRFSGIDGLIIQGASKEPVYLYIHDDNVEIRDAKHLVGKDTWETAETIEKDLNKNQNQISILAIGPAGENLVRFACTVNDRGHVASHDGPGAVLGSKKLKAIVIERGSFKVELSDRKAASSIIKQIIETKTKKSAMDLHNSGTSKCINLFNDIGILPVKNYTSADGSEYKKLDGGYYRERFDLKRVPCWGCGFKHTHMIKVTEGPYSGFEGEEPEYECMASWGPLIGQTDPGAAVMLSNLVDRLGIDSNEAGWVIAWLMECFEKGILTGKEIDGSHMTWGNVEATKKVLEDISYRRGFGNLLAEGAMRAATKIGGEAEKIAIYTNKGNTPRTHDHRSVWNMLLDTTVSSIGSDEISAMLNNPVTLGLPAETDRNTAEGAAAIVAAGARMSVKILMDSFPICYLGVNGATPDELAQLLRAATGLEYTAEEVSGLGLRIHNLLRSFGVRCGHTKEMDKPSLRYASAVLKGPATGREFYPVWEKARDEYYKHMGWDIATGKPLPETLKKLGLEFVIPGLWE